MQSATMKAGSDDIERPGGGASYAFVTVAGSAEGGDIRQVGCGNLHLYLNGNATVSAALAVTVYAGLATFVAPERGELPLAASAATTTCAGDPQGKLTGFARAATANLA